jgi:hypothetical protein
LVIEAKDTGDGTTTGMHGFHKLMKAVDDKIAAARGYWLI